MFDEPGQRMLPGRGVDRRGILAQRLLEVAVKLGVPKTAVGVSRYFNSITVFWPGGEHSINQSSILISERSEAKGK